MDVGHLTDVHAIRGSPGEGRDECLCETESVSLGEAALDPGDGAYLACEADLTKGDKVGW